MSAVRLLLVSTYELGHQPLGLAGPAAVLGGAGHEVRCRDLAVEDLPDADLDWADALVCSVPMHTAARLALELVSRARERRPGLPVALHGRFAPALAASGALGDGDLLAAGDTSGPLTSWARDLARPRSDVGGPSVSVVIGAANTGAGPLPDRSALAGLDRYARLVLGPEERLAGTVEATQGCAHRCRHCPVPAVYDGRTRALP